MTSVLHPDRWRRVEELFDEAAALPADARSRFLSESCGDDAGLRAEVQSLLDEDAADARAFDSGIHQGLAEAAAGIQDEAAPIPSRVGPYRLISEIGSGGMGTVYLAERDDDEFHQRVAVKVVRAHLGASGLKRFRAERQILASLQHPYIARLLDGGTTTEGLPYLVMEQIEGTRIDEYCAAHDLSIAARLALFCRVCDAVSHAHRSLVVHRDLKPSNILVTADGSPKLLDFGIAKLLDADDTDAMFQTSPSVRVMTPEYASPEQIRGQAITTATDVYSLGVLLFELLTGVLPHRLDSRNPETLTRTICEVEAPRPSLVAGTSSKRKRELSGDLDTIVLAALRKEPERRYGSVDQFKDDVQRHLDGRPVHARPATWRYRSQRFVQRHRFGVATAAAVVLLIVGFSGALVVYAARAARERDTAERVTTMLVDMFSAADPSEARGNTVTAREMLDRGAARIDQVLGNEPEARARVLDALGSLYFSLGIWEPAQALLTNAVDVRRDAGTADSLQAAATLARLADVLIWRGQIAAAEPLVRRSLELRRQRLGPTHADVAASVEMLARVVAGLGRPWSEVEPLHVEAIAIWRRALGADTAAVGGALMELARGRSSAGDHAGAEQAARDSLAAQRRAYGEVHPAVATSLLTLGLVLQQGGHTQQAEAPMRESLAMRRALYKTDDHPFVHQSMNNLVTILQAEGKLAEAEPLSRLAVDRSLATLGVHNGTTANLRGLGAVLEDEGKLAEAETAYRDSLTMARKLRGGEALAASALIGLARIQLMTGRTKDAMASADEALALFRGRYGDDHIQVAPALAMRAEVLAAAGRPEEADAAFRDVLARQRKTLSPGHANTIATMLAYGLFLLDTPRAAEAEPFLKEAYEAHETQLPPGHWSRGEATLAYGAALASAGRKTEGEPLMRAGYTALSAAFPAGDPRITEAKRLITRR